MRFDGRVAVCAGWLSLVVALNATSSCGSSDALDASADASDDASIADALADFDAAETADSGDGDGAEGCSHRQPCDPSGPGCTNGCGSPCTCIPVGIGYGWDCEMHLTGELCDPAVYDKPFDQCIYPPDFNADLTSCACQAPAGEHFWICDTYVTVCPATAPADGESCAAFPAGLWCHYFLQDAGRDHSCECVNDGQKLWRC